MFAQPQQEIVGQKFFGGGGEVDGHDDHVDSNSSVSLADVDIWGEDVLGHFVHPVGPSGPFGVFTGVGGNQQAGNQQRQGNHFATPVVSLNKVSERGFVRKVAQEHSIHSLDLDGFCRSQYTFA